MKLPAWSQQPGSPERLQKPQDGIWRHFQVTQHQENIKALMVRRRQKPCLQQMVPVMDEGANGVFPLLQLIAGVPAEEDTAHGARQKLTMGGKRKSRTKAQEVAQLCKRAARKRDGALLAIKIKFTARLSPGEGEGRGGASWERDGAGKRGSLAFCSHRRGKAVSFAGLIGLMRFPYSSLRGCQ